MVKEIRFLVKIYRAAFLSLRSIFFVPSCCCFVPSCSEYFLQSVEKFGILKGFWMGTMRVFSCHPFSKISLKNHLFQAFSSPTYFASHPPPTAETIVVNCKKENNFDMLHKQLVGEQLSLMFTAQFNAFPDQIKKFESDNFISQLQKTKTSCKVGGGLKWKKT